MRKGMRNMLLKFNRVELAAGLLVMSIGLVNPLRASTQIKIMPLGDSITQGGHTGRVAANLATVGYRYDLYFHLIKSGFDVDFVGTQNSIDRCAPNPVDYPHYNSVFDRDHQGAWGPTAVFLDSAMNSCLESLGDNLPDIILIHAGPGLVPVYVQIDTK